LDLVILLVAVLGCSCSSSCAAIAMVVSGCRWSLELVWFGLVWFGLVVECCRQSH
jgi:hypothetical protein